MQVYIVNFGYRRFRYLPMTELFLADAISKKGNHQVKIYTIMNNESNDETIDILKAHGDSFITIIWETLSSKSVSYIKKSMEFARLYKEKCKYPLLVGGYWATTAISYFEETKYFDHIIEGYSADHIANALNNWEVTKKKRSINALAQIDWNQYDLNINFLADPSKYFHKPNHFLSGYLTSIGCPNACTFCYNTVLQDKQTCYSERSVEKIKEDLDILDQEYHFKTIQLKDLNFFYNTKRAFNILDFLKNRGKRIQHAVDITVKDASEDIFTKISNYDITELWIGLESFNENSLKKMNKEYSKKKLEQVFSWADKYNILLFGNIMLGAPWQDRKYIEDTIATALQYIKKYRYVMIMFNTLRPIIGTPIQKEYFPEIYHKLSFSEMVDAFSFYLGEKQQKIYGKRYEFIDFEKVHNAFWFINHLKIIENQPNTWGRSVINFMRKRIEKELRPPFFSSKYLNKFFLIKHSTRERIMYLVLICFMLIQIHKYLTYFKILISKLKKSNINIRENIWSKR